MSIRNENTIIKSVTKGFNRVDRLSSDDLTSDSTLYKAQNVDLTRGPGVVMTAPGYSVGSNIAVGTLYGAYCFFTSSNTTIPLAHIGGTMYRYVGSWSATGFTTLASANSEFTTFLDYVFITDGTQFKSSNDGSTWGTTKLTSAPTSGVIDIETFKVRLYTLSKTALYWSSLPDGSLAITWNTTDHNVQIDPYDGDYCTAMAKLRQRLLVFKRYSTKRFVQYSDTDVDITPVSDSVGIPNPRAYATDPDGTLCYMFGTTREGYKGIYVTDGEYMNIISRPIQDILDGVPESAFSSICGSVVNNKVKFYLGNVTLKDGSTITKCEIQYSPVDRLWQWRSLNHAPVTYQPFVVSTTRASYFLDTNSNIYQDETGSTFGGNPIHCEIETPWKRFDEPATQLTTRELTVTGRNLQKFQARVRAVEGESWIFSVARVIKSFLNQSTPTAKGSRFKFNVTWTQPTMTYENDRVGVEQISVGFKDHKEPIQ